MARPPTSRMEVLRRTARTRGCRVHLDGHANQRADSNTETHGMARATVSGISMTFPGGSGEASPDNGRPRTPAYNMTKNITAQRVRDSG